MACQRTNLGSRSGTRLTQSLLEGLHIATLGAALPALFIVGASMAKTRASTTTGSHTIALELALSTYHASQSLGLGHTRVVGDVLLSRAIVSIGVVVSRSFIAAGGRSIFR